MKSKQMNVINIIADYLKKTNGSFRTPNKTRNAPFVSFVTC